MTASQMRGGIFAVMVVRIGDPHDPALDREIGEQVERSPGFFADAPVVLDLKDCPGCTSVGEYVTVKTALRRHRLIPVGVQNANEAQRRAAMATDLAPFSPMGGGDRRAGERPPMPNGTGNGSANGVTGRAKLVTQPVRSGTQIYARGADLIVVAPVSAGAEVVADGHLHIYGALRGRAIAGAAGDQAARIFVQRLEAELVCIAGRYLVSEAIPGEHLRQPVQVAIVEDQLRIVPGWGQ
jgi:septum site-determining protein MinC